MAVLGFSGAILHVLNHSVFKSLLFYAAGIVYQKTHTVDIERLGGLAKNLPFTATAFLIGSLAISGLPPLNGFISEFFIYLGIFKGLKSNILLSVSLVLTISGLAFIGAMALLCFTKAFGVVFLGSPRSHYPDTFFNVGLAVKIPMIIECLIIAGIGLFPAQVFSVIIGITSQFVEIKGYSVETTLQILGNLSKGFFIFLMIAASILLLRYLMLCKRSVYRYKTWDCGYQAGNVRMQYSASSYAAPFITIIKPVLDYEEYVKHPAGYNTEPFAGREILKKRVADIFPVSGSFESHTEDRIETMVIFPVLNAISRFLNLFSWIQSGSIQQYILYGLIFLVAITIAIMGV
jgi:hydrogenase-4 component B